MVSSGDTATNGTPDRSPASRLLGKFDRSRPISPDGKTAETPALKSSAPVPSSAISSVPSDKTANPNGLTSPSATTSAAGADNAECQRRFAEAQSKLTIEQGQVTSSQEQSQLVFAALNREKEFSAKLAQRNSELERGNIDLTDRVKELTTNVEMARAQVRALQQQIAAMDARGGTMGATQIPGGEAIVEADVPSVSAPAMPMVTASGKSIALAILRR